MKRGTKEGLEKDAASRRGKDMCPIAARRSTAPDVRRPWRKIGLQCYVEEATATLAQPGPRAGAAQLWGPTRGWRARDGRAPRLREAVCRPGGDGGDGGAGPRIWDPEPPDFENFRLPADFT